MKSYMFTGQKSRNESRQEVKWEVEHSVHFTEARGQNPLHQDPMQVTKRNVEDRRKEMEDRRKSTYSQGEFQFYSKVTFYQS